MARPRATILVVEDHAELRRMILRMLEENGFAALEAADGTEGLAVFQGHRESIALAIIDMMMPGMSGLDLAAELDRQRPGMRILYISGNAASIAMDVIARRSPELVLPKPFNERQLVERLELLLLTPERHPRFLPNAASH